MAVYVDFACKPYRGMYMSHMTADTLDELHAMAAMIGLRCEWFQAKRLPHYDVCKAKRRLALKNGARAVSMREIIEIAKRCT